MKRATQSKEKSSIMHMRVVPKISLSSGKPPGRPPDSDFVGKTSQLSALNSDPGGFGALEEKATTLGDCVSSIRREIFFPYHHQPLSFLIPCYGRRRMEGTNFQCTSLA